MSCVLAKVPRLVAAAAQSRTFTRLSQTSVFLQNGFRIRELPMVVKKVNDVLQIDSGPAGGDIKLMRSYPDLMDDETSEIIAGLNRTVTTNGLFRLLETIPADDVTPIVAVHALKRIINLENNMAMRSNKQAPLVTHVGPGEKANETFLRFAFINMLLDIVYRSRDPKIILEGLRIVSFDTFPEDPRQTETYKERLYEETLVLITEGLFSLVEICDAVSILGTFYIGDKKRSLQMADRLWAGILDKADNELNASTMANVFSTLPFLKSGRDVILMQLNKKIGVYWQDYKTRDILEILRIMTVLGPVQTNGFRSILPVICQWLSVNVHTLTEAELLAIVVCMNRLEFASPTFTRTLSKYMRLRGVRVADANLVASICEYCNDVRVRSPSILEGAAEFFVENSSRLAAPQIYSVARIFGELDFHPPNGFKFWDTLEHVLEHKFAAFPPMHAVRLLMSFVHIEMFPHNFVRKVFNPHFMDRVHSQPEPDIRYTRGLLQVFDAAMKLECDNYSGPYLPKGRGGFLGRDLRPGKTAKDLLEPMCDIVGDVKRLGLDVYLSNMPNNPLYIVDLIVYPSVAASLLRLGYAPQYNSQTTVMLVHVPEHFDKSRENLVGSQAMRVRHLKKLGFKVMNVDFRTVKQLMVMPTKLREYLYEEYKRANDGDTTSS